MEFTCAGCGTEHSGEPIRITSGSDVDDVCSVECLMIFAAHKFAALRDTQRSRIAELEDRLERETHRQCPYCHHAL